MGVGGLRHANHQARVQQDLHTESHVLVCRWAYAWLPVGKDIVQKLACSHCIACSMVVRVSFDVYGLVEFKMVGAMHAFMAVLIADVMQPQGPYILQNNCLMQFCTAGCMVWMW